MDSTKRVETVVGLDVGAKLTNICVAQGAEILEETVIPTDRESLELFFKERPRDAVRMEVGGSSRWMSQVLRDMDFPVVVADARRLPRNMNSGRKNDRNDARWLATLEDRMIKGIYHRSSRHQIDLEVLRARDLLVRQRTSLVNHLRGVARSHGIKIKAGSPEAIPKAVAAAVFPELLDSIQEVLVMTTELSRKIAALDRKIARLTKTRYPECQRLLQVRGVGPVTALAFVLTIADPDRFPRTRRVGAFVGLVPKLEESGDHSPALGITKAGDRTLRKLLVQCAHYKLGPFGGDCDLQRYGHALVARGGKNAKKRAAVAVARKLAVLLLALWKSGEVWEPLRHAEPKQMVA
ncbi:MAG: hypothetical protein DHS20C15_34880 [Planctomycetota bacterium]|nr:MAG: hypothetical protein DHS20C15_34880 [Planctomycetota bacterium]